MTKNLDDYEIRANWDAVVQDTEVLMMYKMAATTSNVKAKFAVIMMTIARFVYDLKENRFLGFREGSEVLSEMMAQGKANRIFEAIDRVSGDMMKKMLIGGIAKLFMGDDEGMPNLFGEISPSEYKANLEPEETDSVLEKLFGTSNMKSQEDQKDEDTD